MIITKREQFHAQVLNITRNKTTMFLVSLFILGLVLRLMGVLFMGCGDINQRIMQWGDFILKHGLIKGYLVSKINYGPFSLGFFELARFLAKYTPRFWWLPYKLIVIGFEVLVLLTLWRILPVKHRHFALILYWINPYFIFSGGWQGVWDATYVLWGLIAVLVVKELRNKRLAWALVGVLVIIAWLFKPQGLAYFVGPTGLFLALKYIQTRNTEVVWFSIGILGTVIAVSLYLWVESGLINILLLYFRNMSTSGLLICPSCTGIWRSVETGLAILQGVSPWRPYIEPTILRVIDSAAFISVLFLIILFTFKVPLSRYDNLWDSLSKAHSLLLVIAYSSLVFSQIATRAHVNHTYAALVLLIPFAVKDSRLLWAMIGMSAIDFYITLTQYAIGLGTLPHPVHFDPSSGFLGRFEYLFNSFFNSLKGFNYYVWGILGAVQFVLVITVILRLFAASTKQNTCQDFEFM